MNLENDSIRIAVDAGQGGRIASFYDKARRKELLWYDASRLPVNPDLDYDGNFAGGMDELLPNDPPEGDFPDHGELWTTPLLEECCGNSLEVRGTLPISHLSYCRRIHLEGSTMIAEYEIANTGESPLDFLWKLHGAFRIGPGDKLLAPASCVQAADPGDWSKCPHGMPRLWRNPYVIGDMDGTSDFFFLTDLSRGAVELQWREGGGIRCQYDQSVFRSAWIFASFGRLNGSNTLILEPCTNYPMTIAEARRNHVCCHLDPGGILRTAVRWEVI